MTPGIIPASLWFSMAFSNNANLSPSPMTPKSASRACMVSAGNMVNPLPPKISRASEWYTDHIDDLAVLSDKPPRIRGVGVVNVAQG